MWYASTFIGPGSGTGKIKRLIPCQSTAMEQRKKQESERATGLTVTQSLAA